MPLAVRAYSALAPRVAEFRLRPYSDHIFHSPNFILPPFAGPSVATMHDLSTVIYPQFHPAARVALNAARDAANGSPGNTIDYAL